MWKYLIVILILTPVCLHGKREGLTTTPASGRKQGGAGADAQVHRFTYRTTVRVFYTRTTSAMVSFVENCDYLAFYCLKAYDTGTLCGITVNYIYHNFKNYCQLDYVNCMERYNMWQVVHMGECVELKPLTEYAHYPYDDDLFLEQYYIIEDE